MNDKPTPTESQREVSEQLLKLVAENAGKPTIILLTGIGGTGKSLLLEQLKDKIGERGGSLIHVGSIMSHEKGKFSENKMIMAAFHDPKANKVLVASATPREEKRVLERLETHLPGWSTVSCVLKGMSREEIMKYISAKLPTGAKLTLEELADFSLGIPLLADHLIAVNLGKEQALRFSLLFLIEKSVWTKDPKVAKEMTDTFSGRVCQDSKIGNLKWNF